MTSDPISRYLTQRSAKFARRSRLRPMQSGEVMDVAARAYQQLGGIILKHTAVPTLFCLAAFLFETRYVIPSFFNTSNPDSLTTQFGEALGSLALGVFVAGPLFLIGVSYSSAFITFVVADFMNGNLPDAKNAATRARALLPRMFKMTFALLVRATAVLLLAALLLMVSALLGHRATEENVFAGIVALTASLALVVGIVAFPGVVMRYALAVPVFAIESLKIKEALKRSVQLTKQQGFNVTGYNTVVALAVLLLALTVFVYGGIWGTLSVAGLRDVISQSLENSAFHDAVLAAYDFLPWFLLFWTLIPIWSSTTTILYFERRTRLEGYDIEALAQDMWRNAKQSRFQL